MSQITLHQGTADDLDRVNSVVEAALMTWNLPERVKRLSAPSYRYNIHDLEHLTLLVAETEAGDPLGVAAWEAAERSDTPAQRRGLLLHGIYVDPRHHRQGIGGRLLGAALDAARQGGYDGLLVKANKDAQGFFAAMGLQPLPIERPGRDYPYRFWFDFTAATGPVSPPGD